MLSSAVLTLCFNDRTILSNLAAAPLDRANYGMHK